MSQTSISFRPAGFVRCAWVTQVDFLLCIRKRAWNLSNASVWSGLLKTTSVKPKWPYLSSSRTLCELVNHCVSFGISAALATELAISTCKKEVFSKIFLKKKKLIQAILHSEAKRGRISHEFVELNSPNLPNRMAALRLPKGNGSWTMLTPDWCSGACFEKR